MPGASIAVAALGLGAIGLAKRRHAISLAPALGGVVGVALLSFAALPYARIPLGGGMAGAREMPADADALAAFTPLQANVYRAFDYSRESDIYDALAQSVDGALLDHIYDEVYRGLVMREEGGSLARAKSVGILESRVVAKAIAADGHPSFQIRAAWRVEGVVYHWGHSHARTNEYKANYTIETRPEGWRIVALEPLEQRRIQSEAQANSAASAPNEPAATPQAPGGTWHPDR
jgi:hypothetical protein